MVNPYILALVLLSSQLPPSSYAYRLPTIITPHHYEVHINISSSAFTASSNAFVGAAAIHFTTSEPASEIKLHASSNFIAITDITLNDQLIPAESYSTNSTTDILTINLNSNLETERLYILLINYVSQLSVTDIYGFYKSRYVDSNGVTRYLATTQFQPTHARRAFPCWDEPSFKATFSIIITYPTGLNALSNTPGNERIVDEETNLTTIQFDTTPPMSTYLVAFIVSDYTCTSGENISTVPYRVCSRPNSESTRGWAVEVGPKALAALNEFTDYNYSEAMSKMDQVAVPDLSFGAMENWGLVTYRESGLLWDPYESSNSNKQSVASVITHEFTHMWFGNLVTCNWWSVAFLNEGFAQLFQYYILDEILPEWELKKQFVTVVTHGILDTDSYLTASPLQSDASTPSEVSNKFGSITYSKGASIFRMVRETLGSTNFRDGLRSYLKTYHFSSTTPQNLWTSLSAYVDDSVSILPADLNTVMHNWVETSGYPLLTVRVTGRNVQVSQERFLLSGSDAISKWYIPVSFTTSADSNKFEKTSPDDWLTPTADLSIVLPSDANWIILNNQEAGYYRVNYESSLWTNISAALLSSNFSGIPDLNRAQIVNDVFNLAKVHKIEYSKVFEVLQFLENDVSYFSWYPAFSGFSYLIGRIGQESVLGKAITEHLSQLMTNLYQSVPVTHLHEDNQIYTLNQVLAVNWACRLGIADCVNSVKQIFREYKVNEVRPNKNLKSIVYCNALRYSDDYSDWEFLWQTYVSTELATERSVLITALGCTKNETTLNNYLAKSIDSSSEIRSQDASSVFAAVYGGNPGGVDVAFDFLVQYHVAIDNYYQSVNSLSNLMNGIASRFTNQNQVDQLENFIATSNLSQSFLTAATQSLATAQANIAWIYEYKNDLDAYYGIALDEPEIDELESTLPEYRLSSIFKPSHYEIHLNVSSDAFTATGNRFRGSSTIYFTTTVATNSIRLHSSYEDHTILSITLNNQEVPSGDYSVNSTTDIMTISYENGLYAGIPYVLKFEYIGTIRDSGGFFKRSYVNAQNVTRYLLATQFEAPHARKAFPSFDEPSFKASYQLNITHPTEYNAKSNTNGYIVQTDTYTNQTTIQFDRTPVLSSYLVVFVISDYTCTQGESVDTATFQVCSKEEGRDYRAFAVDVGPKLLTSLNAFTGFNYSTAMGKIDNFALPGFGGAMENWGLVTYGEDYLLWDPLVSTNENRQSLATVMAHEFAHMWFGNLVTCKWWSEIFLNEGFAQYFQYFTAHDVLPDWELDKQFVVRVHQPILSVDSYLTSQALQSPASTPTQISNKFGSITYNKGGSVLRMVKHFMSPENFRTGLQSYLRTHQFSNTKPEDLWTALAVHINANVSHLPTDLESVMENWIKISGFPLLHVSRAGNSIIISQERFLLSGVDTSSKWYIPISYTTSVDQNKFETTTPDAWLTPTSSLTLPYSTGAQWVVLNNYQTAFYRVHYSDELWDALGVALSAANFSGIPDLNRAQIADDLFELLKVNRISYTRAFRVLEFLENDVSYFPWYSTFTEFNDLFVRVGLGTRLGRAMHEHVRRLISNFYESTPLTVIDEDNQLYSLRQIISINFACRLGQANCVSHVREIFKNYITNGTSLPKNLKNLVYCNGIRHSDSKADWDSLWEIYKQTFTSERSIVIQGLGCSLDEDLLWDYLNKSITPGSGLIPGDTASIFSSVYTNHWGIHVALKFLVENYGAIYDYYLNWSSVGSLFSGLAARISSPEQLAQLEGLLASGQLNPQLSTTVTQAIATGRANLEWIETYRKDFYEYYGLEDENTTTTTPTITTTTSIPTTTAPTTTEAPTTPGGATSLSYSFVLILAVVFMNNLFN